MLRDLRLRAMRVALVVLACALVAACGIKGPLRPPPGAKGTPPPPPAGVELPSATQSSE
jgi:predicted small lipoprotein YifL